MAAQTIIDTGEQRPIVSISSIRNRPLRILRRTLISAALFVGVVAVLCIGIEIYDRLPVNPVSAHCFKSRVYFEGPKSGRFNTLYIKWIEEKDQPYFIRNGIIYTTERGSGDENMDKFIMWTIRPEWFSDNPTFDTPEQRAIVEGWRETSVRENRREWSSKDWCHVIEAAIAKDGIDVEARRDHPSIWPPDKWPVPPQD